MPISDLESLLSATKATALARTLDYLRTATIAAESGSAHTLHNSLVDALHHAEVYQAASSLEAAWMTIKPHSSN